MLCRTSKIAASLAAAVAVNALLTADANAVGFINFNEAGGVVTGYQDDFTGSSLDPAWFELDQDNDDVGALFVPTGAGSLQMNPANGDPNKLLYNATYDGVNQNVLALMRVVTPGTGDGFRGGVSASSDSASGEGLNLHFRAGPQFNLLDDARAWGPAGETWSTGEWLWLRLVTDGTTVQGKIWEAGATPEPADFDLTWTRGGRTGLAGLATNSLGGTGVFEVDYILIQAEGLPQIEVVPEPTSLALLGLGGLGLLARRRRA